MAQKRLIGEDRSSLSSASNNYADKIYYQVVPALYDGIVTAIRHYVNVSDLGHFGIFETDGLVSFGSIVEYTRSKISVFFSGLSEIYSSSLGKPGEI